MSYNTGCELRSPEDVETAFRGTQLKMDFSKEVEMDGVSVLPGGSAGKCFLPAEFIPEGKNEYYLRDEQLGVNAEKWRNLRPQEIKLLIKNGNIAENWHKILVTEEFEPGLVRNSEFLGLVRIGRLRRAVLGHHDLQMSAGIYNSRIIACDIGDDVAIYNVSYMAHYIIGDCCILKDIDEMHVTSHAKFGNGIVKAGEDEKVRIRLNIVNETGSRAVMPFDGMIAADAYLWARYRDDGELQKRLGEIVQKSFDGRRGFYGTVGARCVIKSCRIIKDVKIGPHCYVKGANKLKNLTINSSESEPSQIGEGVEMVNGIVGLGGHVFYGCKAVRFVMGNNSSLKYGARLLNSFLGDNSTVSCCEILNNLIFGSHQQHHNNSFLIASLVMGQSNIAAGATVGSNHNSRKNDSEIQAGRGFWPGLCVSLKHSCRFASFTLLAKGDYPAEMDIPLPFSLLNNNVSLDRLEVRPAFWWLHNMYALERAPWKFRNRDMRKSKSQNIEFDFLAPDTVEEIINARFLLQVWLAKATARQINESVEGKDDYELAQMGQKLLTESPERTVRLEVLGENMEKSRRKVVILGLCKAWEAYGQMIEYYAAKNLLDFFAADRNAGFESMAQALSAQRQRQWVNLGGQLVAEPDINSLRADIRSGKLDSWEDIHRRYDELWDGYRLAKQRHAFAVLGEIYGGSLSPQQWRHTLDKAHKIQEYICNQVYASRKKDFDNPYRQATYRNIEEMTAAIGTVDDEPFVNYIKEQSKAFCELVETVKKRG